MVTLTDLEEQWTLDSHDRCHVRLLRPPRDRCSQSAAWLSGIVCPEGCWSRVHTYNICDEHYHGIIDAGSPSWVECCVCRGPLQITWAERLT